MQERDEKIHRLMIKRENIANIQQILLNLVKSERENLKHTDTNKLISDIQHLLGKEPGTPAGTPHVDPYATLKAGTGGGGLRDMNIGVQMTPPVRDKGRIEESDTKRREEMPNWYSKLKGKLQK